jgi:YYY domain-containing protein
VTYVFSWWVAVEILGLAALPLAWRLFRNLPDRGYALAKPLGILLTSYVFWLAVSFGLLANTWPAIMVCILLVAAGSASLYLWTADRRVVLLSWLRQNLGLILTHELLFALAFGVWALVRAYNPVISGTEKPMDFAFLNAILRSEYFPPLDPWLSGFAISYYYFGYLMMALLTKLTGVPSEVGFNLAIALLFALTAGGAFGLTYNLVKRHADQEGARQGIATVFGTLGAVFVVVIGNLEGLLEVLHARGLGTAAFWEWIDIKNLATAPVSGTWIPQDNWWWWRASRVVHDVVFGIEQEVIDEFPFFSFLLGDMHPHVLGLPIVLLALGLALNILWSERAVSWWHMVLLGVCIGGLGFLNSWDLPIYFLICVVVYALATRRRLDGFGRRWVIEVGFFALVLMALSFVLYLPFWIGFRSQAGGIMPVLLVKTRLHQYLIMFGTFIYVVAAFLGYELWRTVKALRTDTERSGFQRWAIVGGAALVLAPLAALLLLVKLYLVALLVLLIGTGCMVCWERLRSFSIGSVTSSATFVLILILAALLLTFSVEFVYLKDTFGTRMNTVFKVYYQAWVLFAVASAFGIYYLGPWVSGRRRVLSSLWLAGFVPLFLASMVYPTLATPNKTGGFAGPPTLDGMAHLERAYGDDLAAIRWLRANVEGAPVILEATGGQYTYYGRISVHAGLPTVLGWGGHEHQWRGNYEEPGKREPDIEALYTSPDPGLTSALLDEYGISYVYIGGLERSTYGISPPILSKFERLMDVVYQQGDATIYQRR